MRLDLGLRPAILRFNEWAVPGMGGAFFVRQLSWCKGLSLCAPFEVRSESDLLELTHIARRLVKRESSLMDEFGDYAYRQADWLADYKILEEQNRSQMVSHALA